MNDERSEPRVATLVSSRWRKTLAADLMKVAGYVSTGGELVGAPVIEGVESSVTDPYGLVLVLVGPAGVLVHSVNIRYQGDVKRVQEAIRDAYDPEGADRRAGWRRAELEREARYLSEHPFVCERPGSCWARFKSERGLAAHHRSADRAIALCRDWSHGCGAHPCGKAGAEVPQESGEQPAPPRPALRALHREHPA